YMDLNRREYELRKTVSLAQLDPASLISLRQTGECFITLPESLLRGDHPSHYMLRIKTMAITIPCIAGPFTGVHATLTLVRSRVRRTATVGGDLTEYPAAVQSIATSTAQSDAGLFELNLHDERYLPFEGQGAISEWR